MTFTEAISNVFKDGDRITRTTWHSRDIYCALEEGKLCIWGVPKDDLWHPWTVTEQDYFSTDWEVVMDA